MAKQLLKNKPAEAPAPKAEKPPVADLAAKEAQRVVNKAKQKELAKQIEEDRMRRANEFKEKLFALIEEYQCDIIATPELKAIADGAFVTHAHWSIRPR